MLKTIKLKIECSCGFSKIVELQKNILNIFEIPSFFCPHCFSLLNTILLEKIEEKKD